MQSGMLHLSSRIVLSLWETQEAAVWCFHRHTNIGLEVKAWCLSVGRRTRSQQKVTWPMNLFRNSMVIQNIADFCKGLTVLAHKAAGLWEICESEISQLSVWRSSLNLFSAGCSMTWAIGVPWGERGRSFRFSWEKNRKLLQAPTWMLHQNPATFPHFKKGKERL